MTSFSPLVAHFAILRVALIAMALLLSWALYKRPRPGGALALVIGLNLVAWAAYVRPLERLYGLEVGLDRAFNVGMAATTAAGNSPLDHTQVAVAAPEPFWNIALALLSGMDPARTVLVFHWLPVLAIALIAGGLYFGLDVGEQAGEDRWERMLTVFALFGLGSLTLSQNPVGVLWVSNFLYKPNHGLAWPLVALALGLVARGSRRPFLLGAVLGVLAWVFLMDWAFALPGLALGARWIRTQRPGAGRRTALAIAISVLCALPLVIHLSRDYAPTAAGAAAVHMWRDGQGIILSRPYWSSLDLGPLLVLGVAGAIVWMRRRSARDLVLLASFVAAWATWAASALASHLLGVSPEADELHYYLRLMIALAAGAALAAIGRHLEEWWKLRPGQGAVLALASCLPFTFQAYWDPALMDRYYEAGLTPIHRKVEEYAAWIRTNTAGDAIFLAGGEPATYIPALTGRRVLMAPTKLVPKDVDRRREVARILLGSSDPNAIRAAAAAYGITHVAVDPTLEKDFGPAILESVRASDAYYGVFQSTALWIFEVRPASGPEQPAPAR